MRHVTTALVALVVRRPLISGTLATLLVVGFGMAVATPGIRWRGSAAQADEAAFVLDQPVVGDEAVGSGRPLADFTLADLDGRPVRLREQLGKVVLVNFLTTRCTTACVQVTRELRSLQQTLRSRMGRDVVFLSVGIDPRWDSPAALRAFARRHGVEPGGWAFLSGTAEELVAARRAFGAVAVPVPRGSGHSADDFEHTTTTYLVDRQGVLRKKISPGFLTLTGLQEIETVLGSRL